MPFNGSGTYTPAAAPNFPAVAGDPISSTYYNIVINDLATAMSNMITRDGQGKPNSAINWNGQNLTGVATFGAITGNFSANVNAANITATGSASANGVVYSGTGFALTTNNTGVYFTDVSGTNPQLFCQNDNNFSLIGTDAAGAGRTIFQVGMRSSVSTFNFIVTVTGPTQAPGDNSTNLATTAFVQAAVAGVSFNNAALTGIPTAPTAAINTSTTQIATTAFVDRLRDAPRVTGGLARGSVFATSAGFTVNTSNAGEMYLAYNDSAAGITITQGAGVTLRLHGTTSTGNRTLAARGMCTFWYNGSGEVIVMGDVS
jgi:hypothetical protein